MQAISVQASICWDFCPANTTTVDNRSEGGENCVSSEVQMFP